MTFPDQRGTTERGNALSNEPTLGEVARRLDRMEASTSEHFGKVFAKLDGLAKDFVTQREFDQRMGTVEGKLEKAVDRKWALLIGGSAAITTGVITVIADLIARHP